MTHAELIASLTGAIDRALEPLVPSGSRVAVLDFPNAPNVGDSMIWAGTLEWIRRRRLRVCYTCSNLTYSRAALASRLGDATILLSGGGNFGDLYPDHQELREQVLADFPAQPVVQLPQSIRFESDAALETARRAFGGHPNVTLVVREHASLEIARARFDAPAVLAPDMAFALGAVERPAAPVSPVLWLARTDKEARTPHGAAPAGVEQADWLRDDPSLAEGAHRLLTRLIRFRPHLRPPLQGLVSGTYGPVARERVERGIRILCRGRVVVSDRLHAHVLAVLLGIPHFLLDNTYGKVRALHEAWTRESPLATWCDSEPEAIARALALAARLESGERD